MQFRTDLFNGYILKIVWIVKKKPTLQSEFTALKQKNLIFITIKISR
ncbi:MAG: hypothetical protein ACJAUH_001829 [Saprospiraceae bacterium]|jgi:hypothetical protein